MTLLVPTSNVCDRESVIKSAIERRTNWRVWHLRVELNHGRMLLFGRTVSYYAKQLAQHAAMDFVEPSELPHGIWNEIVVARS
jgi:hypothetical protein